MPKFTIRCEALAGFAAETGKAGQDVAVLVRDSLTSENPQFHVYIQHISNLFFQRVNAHPAGIFKALIVLHKDNMADVYINDFPERARVRVTRNIAAGEKVFTKDISEIVELTFPDIQLEITDALVYVVREGWRFGLYFDFSRELNLEKTAEALASLKYTLLLQTAQSELAAAQTSTKFEVYIFTEGKTDPWHLRKAKERLGINIPIEFNQSDRDVGGPMLLRMCDDYSKMPHGTRVVFMFDSDDMQILKQLNARGKPGEAFQRWGNNVYSFPLPIPPHRKSSACIELYYKDDEITRIDNNGRRLFLSTEFDSRTLKLNTNPTIATTDRNKAANKNISIIDTGVFDTSGSCALSKADFAGYVANDTGNFNNFDFKEFRNIFDIIEAILKDIHGV